MTNVIKQIVRPGEYGTQTIKMIVRSNERGPKGEKGDPGDGATVTAGQAYSIPASQQPSVMNTGTSSNAVFDFYIPEGKKGEDGKAATIQVGETTTLAPGRDASVQNIGTSSEAIFNFKIPRGDTGAQGAQGVPGPRGLQGLPGKDGAIQYVAGTGIQITDGNVIQATGAAVATWGGIQGTMSDQTDLQSALNAKQDVLTAGDAINITGNVISADIYPADFFTAGETLTGTGSNITLNETIPAKLKSVELYGDTFQQTYSGKNLINTPDGTRSSGGLDIVWSDNICTFSGTASSTSAILTTLTTLSQNLPQGTYVFSIQEATTYDIRLSVLNADTSNYVNYDIAAGSTSVSININYNTVSYRILAKGWSNGDSVSGTLKQPMFEAGSTPTDYQPFVGGTASPNPSYPQTVNVVTGEQTVEVVGKNLLNIPDNTLVNADVTWVCSNNTIVGDGTYDSNSTWTKTMDFTDFATPLPVGTYTLSMAKPLTKRVEFALRASDGTAPVSGNNPRIAIGDTSVTFTTTKITKDFRIVLYDMVQNEVLNNYTIGSLQLEAGSTATQFEARQAYTVDLGSVELCKIGNYQDKIYKSGDDWYVHKETKKVVFDGSEDEDWATGTSGSVRFFRIDTSDGAENSEHLVKIISDRFIGRFDTVSNSIAMSGTYQGRILIFINGITNDVAVWKTWLSNNNVTAYYALATATNTKITDNNLIGQLNALASANAYLDVTHFLTTATGTNLPVILDIVAYKKSLDGVINSIPNAQVQSNWTQADTTAPDYIKNKPTIPAAQIQSDWDQADNSAVDYIKNKPTIPTVNDATLTIQQNGVDITTFTANASSNATANITSPVITMTTTDPGEGSVLADNNYIGVYGGDPIIMDYSIIEVNTGAKWINGSTIYKKTVNTGALPNATTKNVAHGISNLSKIIRLEGYGLRSTDNVMFPLPFASPTGATADISVTVNGTNIAIGTGVDRSNITESYITLYYTKSS